VFVCGSRSRSSSGLLCPPADPLLVALHSLTPRALFFFHSPLVAGTSEGDQLDRIFRLLGTPTVQDYPGIVELPDYSPEQFPPYPPPRAGLASLVPTLDVTGVDLLSQMLQYDPARRVTAQAALQHAFFSEMKGGR
jgi:serine/threonine protein kinase